MSAFDTVRGFDLSLAQTFGKPIKNVAKFSKIILGYGSA